MGTRLTLLTLVILLAGALPLSANNRADSLIAVLQTLPEDTSKVLTLNELFKTYLYSDPDRAHAYALRAYTLSQQIGWEDGTAKMANNLGVYHTKQGEFDQSLKYYEEVMTIRQRQKDSVEIANVYRNVGSVYFRRSEYPKSMDHFQKAFRLYFAHQDTAGMVAAVGNIASVQKEMGAYTEAQNAFLYVLEMQETQGNYREVARMAMSIGDIQQLEGDNAAARAWYQRGKTIADSIQDNFLRASAMNGLAELMIEDQRWQAAKIYADSARAVSIEVGDLYSEALALVSTARVLSHRGDRAQAKQNLQRALDLCRQIGRRQGEALVMYRLGELYLADGQPALATPLLKEAATMSREIKARFQERDILDRLSNAYANTGNYKDAYDTHIAFFALHDSIFDADKSRQITEAQERFHAGEQQRKIDQLNLEHTQDQLRIVRSRQRSYFLLAAILLFMVTAVFFYLRVRLNRKLAQQIALKNKEISAQRDFAELQNLRILQINSNLEQLVAARTAAVVEAKHELDTFLYESAHALRRPLTRIYGLMDLLQQEQNPAQAEILKDRLQFTLDDMDALLHKLIMANENSRRDPMIEPVNAYDIVCLNLDNHQDHKATIHNSLTPGTRLHTDAYLFNNIVSALIHNALAYHPADPQHQPQVWIDLRRQDHLWHMTVTDNGTGVAPDQKDKVFDMFHRGTVKGAGHGLGLYIARKAIERLGGTIHLHDNPQGGTTLEIHLPHHT